MLSAKFLKKNIASGIPLAVGCGIALSTLAALAAPNSLEQKTDAALGAHRLAATASGAKTDRRIAIKPVASDVKAGGMTALESGASVAKADGMTALKPLASDTKADGVSPIKPVANGARTDSTTMIENDSTGGAKPEAIKPVETDATGGANLGATPNTGSSGAETGTTGTGVTAKEAQITPIESNAAEEEDPYAVYNKQQMALFQQHEAVQHYNAAQYYMKKWDNELAELELRAAIMYMPELRIAHRDYCIVAILRGKLLRAVAEFCMVFGIGEPLPLTEIQQNALRTEASQAHYKKGLELAAKGNWDESISELMWSRTYLPNDPAIHRSLAFAYASKGDFKMAEQYYKSTFSIDPNDAFAHADFAYLLSQKGKKDQAVSEMAKAVKADPDSTALHVDLGWLAESKGDYNTAEAEFRAALKRAPQYGQLWYHLGQILEHRHKASDALAAYKTAVEKEPSNDKAQAALARLGSPVSTKEVTPLNSPNKTKAPTADRSAPTKAASPLNESTQLKTEAQNKPGQSAQTKVPATP